MSEDLIPSKRETSEPESEPKLEGIKKYKESESESEKPKHKKKTKYSDSSSSSYPNEKVKKDKFKKKEEKQKKKEKKAEKNKKKFSDSDSSDSSPPRKVKSKGIVETIDEDEEYWPSDEDSDDFNLSQFSEEERIHGDMPGFNLEEYLKFKEQERQIEEQKHYIEVDIGPKSDLKPDGVPDTKCETLDENNKGSQPKLD